MDHSVRRASCIAVDEIAVPSADHGSVDSRPPSLPPVLWQFTISHFNEKVRWALDWKHVRHVRRALVPGFHIPRVVWMTRQSALPVLAVDGEPIADSTRIIAA